MVVVEDHLPCPFLRLFPESLQGVRHAPMQVQQPAFEPLTHAVTRVPALLQQRARREQLREVQRPEQHVPEPRFLGVRSDSSSASTISEWISAMYPGTSPYVNSRPQPFAALTWRAIPAIPPRERLRKGLLRSAWCVPSYVPQWWKETVSGAPWTAPRARGPQPPPTGGLHVGWSGAPGPPRIGRTRASGHPRPRPRPFPALAGRASHTRASRRMPATTSGCQYVCPSPGFAVLPRPAGSPPPAPAACPVSRNPTSPQQRDHRRGRCAMPLLRMARPMASSFR